VKDHDKQTFRTPLLLIGHTYGYIRTFVRLGGRMDKERGTRSRLGRSALIDAAADLFAEVDLDAVTAFLGPRAVARRAGVAVGTVTYHFPKSVGDLGQAALAQAFGRAGDTQLAALAESMEAAGSGDGKSEETAIGDFMAALAQNVEANSPDHGPADPIVEARETALFLAASVAPRDKRAATALEDSLESNRLIRESIAERMLAHRRRRWRDGITKETAALAQEALVFGFLMIRRFDKLRGRSDVYTAMAMRLFDACTVPESIAETPDYHDSLLVRPKIPRLDMEKRAAIALAAARVYEDSGWHGLTTVAVAEEAGVSRATVVANFNDQRGLAAAVWARRMPELRPASEHDAELPLHRAAHATFERLATTARRDRTLSAAFLEGVLAFAMEHGPPVPGNLADPRNLVPLPQLLKPIIQRHSSQFRPGNADIDQQVSDTAELLTDQVMHLAMTRPDLSEAEVAERVCSTTLAGLLNRRPSSRVERL
jgi:AcrR family transcriptional regulator